MARKIYLNTVTMEEAKARFHAALAPFFAAAETERIPVRQALHRVSSEAVYARLSSPLYHSCAMDGIMVQSKDTAAARESEPLFLADDKFQACDTGDPLLAPYDAVIMAEDITPAEGGVTILAPAHPWEHVRPLGEDIVEKDLLFTQHHAFRPIDLSVMVAAGLSEVSVVKRPRLALIPTGDEIVVGEDAPHLGEIIESNTAMFAGLAEEAGAEATVLPIVPDKKDALRAAAEKALAEYDVVCMLAGSSAGRDDYTVEIAQELGEVIVHGISIKPGKPAILAVAQGKPFIGIPGYPVSGHIIFSEIVQPVLRKKGHVAEPEEAVLEGTLTRNVISSLQHQEYIRVKVGRIDADHIAVTPMDRGAGASLSLAQSDGYLIVPRQSEGLQRGESVRVRLHEPMPARVLEERLVTIGSHDMILDAINDVLAEQNETVALLSSHVGSLAGLSSLRQKECALAPSHLLDEAGTYNNEAMQMFFSGEEMAAIYVVGRRQGIIVPAGNPEGIRGFEDLPGKRMINRQRGAGTRVLFDYLLKEKNLTPEQFPGYEWEATTHLAVALAVKNGDAEFGIGVESAARKMGCDFIYLSDEAYEFITYAQWLEKPAVQRVLQLLQSDAFKGRAEALGGYATEHCGEVRRERVE